ncbi:porphobilinogen deaminase [Clostridium thermobutyricum]|uniref:Porphobilinogen deaminase n=1 Tax=Clostridium thermobutyricum TaxID=29372 RepID=N9XRM1_9CLOT|nr:hydroxymethylbilane synthase [Clostridium thermobutyricum]ENZ02343.1 porphobilinogen deaminase [Clostridium thermobutyricum]
MKYIIGTRKSLLAQVQADYVMKLLKDKKGIDSEKLLMVTEGDRRLDVALNKIGGKGLFIKEIEKALIDGRSHLAVHSMKDVPYELEEEFVLAAMPEREDVRDVLVSNGRLLKDIKKGGKIGTSSIRRAEMLKHLRPDLEIVPIRGNVQTRIKKMEEQGLDGIILAAAGLKRLGMEDIITEYFDPKEFLPAVGQGALGIECLKTFEDLDIIKSLDNKEVRIAVDAERSFMKRLNGDCHSLIGIYSEINGDKLYLKGAYKVNGKLVIKDIEGNIKNNIALGEELAESILRG